MGRKPAELLEWVRQNPKSVEFRDLLRLVKAIGYVLDRQKGSHQIYRHPTAAGLPIINLQEDGKDAKPYQVRQVLQVIDEHGLEVQ